MTDLEKVLALVSIALACLSISVAVDADDTTIYLSNGASVVVPDESWKVVAVPRGFNTHQYDEDTNPKGKLPGYGGWPEYDGADCGPELSLGGQPSCDRQPYFVTGDSECGGLSLGGSAVPCPE